MGRTRDDIRILIVDDSEKFLDPFLAWIASQPGIDVAGVATNGEEALEAVALERPDAVVMDAAMPRMSGIAATQAIKTGPDAPPIVILTLHNSQAARSAAHVAGADGFVAKTDLTDKLLPVLRSVCGRSEGGNRSKRRSTSRGRLRFWS